MKDKIKDLIVQLGVKKLAIIGAVVVIAIVGTVVGVSALKPANEVVEEDTSKDKQVVAEYSTKIENASRKFSELQVREEKLDVLKNIINESKEYANSQNPIDTIEQAYQKEIQLMQLYFTAEYDKNIEENSLSDVETVTDKELLNTAKNNLSALLEIMKSEHEWTLSEETYTEYTSKINALLEGYNSRIAEVEKVEEEAKLQAEAEAKAQQEAKSKQQSNKTSSSNTQTSGNNTQQNVQEDTMQEIVKGPKPAKYSVVQAYDFPNDFPSDGWSWHYSTYVWTPQSVFWAWDEERGYYVGDIEWVVALRSTTSNTDISLAPETIENVKKLMVPAPTLEQSQELVKEGDNFFYIRYGAINVYVCMEE